MAHHFVRAAAAAHLP